MTSSSSRPADVLDTADRLEHDLKFMRLEHCQRRRRRPTIGEGAYRVRSLRIRCAFRAIWARLERGDA